MQITRSFAVLFVAATAALSSACGFGGTSATQTTTVTVTAAPPAASDPGTPVGYDQAVPLYPAADIIGELARTNWGLGCKAGLKSVGLPTYGSGTSIGSTRVLIDTQYDSSVSHITSTKTLITFQGAIPEVKGAYVTTFNDPNDAKDLIATDHAVAWMPGMEHSFSVDNGDFGLESVNKVTLCIDQ